MGGWEVLWWKFFCNVGQQGQCRVFHLLPRNSRKYGKVAWRLRRGLPRCMGQQAAHPGHNQQHATSASGPPTSSLHQHRLLAQDQDVVLISPRPRYPAKLLCLAVLPLASCRGSADSTTSLHMVVPQVVLHNTPLIAPTSSTKCADISRPLNTLAAAAAAACRLARGV